jgi:histidinol-phosphate/aromatic aminotransferase/cobyric acid decarboxylase-like protein/GTP:adenosylcobinamide-phosphate guanylyltransferase
MAECFINKKKGIFMQGLILAAGMGRRLGRLTEDNTKCMVKVNGVRLIDRMLTQLAAHGIEKTTIVIGYAAEKLKAHVGYNWNGMKIEYIENKDYATTNNIYSLSLASDVLCADDTLLLESDIILEDDVLAHILEDSRPNIACVDAFKNWMDGTVVTLDRDNVVQSFIGKDAFDWNCASSYYKTVNVYKLSKEFSEKDYVPFLKAYSHSQGNNEYYEQVLKVIVQLGRTPIYALALNGEKWYEIDDVQDLDIAESMFCDAEEKIQKITSRFGGYWRYPDMKDFCYLVNPGFPTRRLKNEILAAFDDLVGSYPSGQRVNAMLAGKMVGLPASFMAVGNGAAELIKAYIDMQTGSVGFVYPTFEEYPNRLPEERREVFIPSQDGFRYSADDLIDCFSKKKINTLILVNPDNPSGNFLPSGDLKKLVSWACDMGISLLIDESFVDFAEVPYSCLDEDFLLQNPHVAVIKSISKSYGVPGVRLGFIASSDEKFIARIRDSISIWNINSFGEYFMQIIGKHEQDYRDSCRKLAKERRRFIDELGNVPFITVYPSDANYLLLGVKQPYSTTGLQKELLEKYGILIKDCSTKKGFNGHPFLRIAVRDEDDNNCLLNALREISGR